MLVISKTNTDAIWANASVQLLIKLLLVSSIVCYLLTVPNQNLHSGDIAVSEKTLHKLLKVRSDPNTAKWNAFPNSTVDIWDQNLVNEEYIIAFELNSGLGQSLQNLLPEVYNKADVWNINYHMIWIGEIQWLRVDWIWKVPHVPSQARGKGLCEIDSLYSRKIQKNISKLGSHGTAELNRYYYINDKTRIVGLISHTRYE